MKKFKKVLRITAKVLAWVECLKGCLLHHLKVQNW